MADESFPLRKPQVLPVITSISDAKKPTAVLTSLDNTNIGIHEFKDGDKSVIINGKGLEGQVTGTGNTDISLATGNQDNLRIIGSPKEEDVDRIAFPGDISKYDITPTGNFEVNPPAIDQVTVKPKGSKDAGVVLKNFGGKSDRLKFNKTEFDLQGAITGKPLLKPEPEPIRAELTPAERGTVIR